MAEKAIRSSGLPPAQQAQLTADAVADYFAHLASGPVSRYEWPGVDGFNFVLERALGGGGTGSLRHDPQGKAYAQLLLDFEIVVPPDLMPLPIWLAHRLAEQLTEVRKSGAIPYLRPDGKTQVTFDYEDGRPVRLRTVLISTQHAPGIENGHIAAGSLKGGDLVQRVLLQKRRDGRDLRDAGGPAWRDRVPNAPC